jgi:hypothetical protein
VGKFGAVGGMGLWNLCFCVLLFLLGLEKGFEIGVETLGGWGLGLLLLDMCLERACDADGVVGSELRHDYEAVHRG